MSKLAKNNRPRSKNGKGSLGMQSVVYGIDNNPEVTAADAKAKFIAKNKKQMNFKDKELRGYLGSATVFLLVMGLLLFLAFFEIPDTNNDIFKVIVGMLVGSLSLVITTFVGKDPSEVENLKAKVESYEKQIKSLTIEKDKVEKMLRDYQSEVIEKLAIAGDNFDYGKKNKK